MGHRTAVAFAIAMALGAIGASQACSISAETATMFIDLGRVVGAPAARAFEAEAAALAAATSGLRDGPSAASLDVAQVAWRRARAKWKRIEPIGLEPIARLGLQAKIDFWPANEARIEAAIQAAGTTVDLSELGANQKGFLALEYLLFEPQGGNAELLARLTANDGGGRRALVAALGDDLARQAAALRSAWDLLSVELIGVGTTSRSFPTQQSALNDVVSKLAETTERIADMWLERPLGARTGGVVSPEAEGAPRSDNSLADLIELVGGVRMALLCEDGPTRGVSLVDVVRRRDAALAERVVARLDAAAAALRAIPAPLRTAVTQSRASVEEALARAFELHRILATEVVAALGVSLTYTSTDGD